MTTNQPPITRLLREDEVAEILNISVKALQRWRWIGQGPAYIKLCKSAVRYEEADLLDFIRSSQRQSTSE